MKSKRTFKMSLFFQLWNYSFGNCVDYKRETCVPLHLWGFELCHQFMLGNGSLFTLQFGYHDSANKMATFTIGRYPISSSPAAVLCPCHFECILGPEKKHILSGKGIVSVRFDTGRVEREDAITNNYSNTSHSWNCNSKNIIFNQLCFVDNNR